MVATTTHQMDAAISSGLSYYYACVEEMIVVSAASVEITVAEITMVVTHLSGFFFFPASVEMVIPAAKYYLANFRLRKEPIFISQIYLAYD